MTKTRAALSLLPAAMLVFASCATQIVGSLEADGRANLHINAALQPRMTALLTAFAAAAGMAPGAPLLDGPAISESMAHAPGIDSVSLANTSPVSIDGRVGVSRIGDFLAAGGRDFISFEQGDGGGGRLTASLDRATGREMLALISPDLNGYLAALMAPVATGEAMTRAQYLSLVTAVYGAAIAQEISSATIRAFVDFPGPIQSVRGGAFSGRRAEFAIPLLDVMVLESPLSYEVVWR